MKQAHTRGDLQPGGIDGRGPWDIAAERLMVKAKCTLATARDYVIFEWLLQGKPHALAGFLIQGHTPGREVLRYLGLMIGSPNFVGKLSPFWQNALRYHFIVKSRSGTKGRRKDPEVSLRDELIVENMKRLMAGGMTYDEAVTRIEEFGRDLGVQVEPETMRKARYGKKLRK